MKRDHQGDGQEPLIGLSAEPVVPPPALRSRLLARIAAEAEYRPEVSVRAGQGAWLPTGIRGISIKPLYQHPGSFLKTLLLRMEPGSVLPAHRHGDAEQCLVIEGDLRWEDLEYHTGDFVVARAGTRHPQLTTENGNVLLLVTGDNEFIAA